MKCWVFLIYQHQKVHKRMKKKLTSVQLVAIQIQMFVGCLFYQRQKVYKRTQPLNVLVALDSDAVVCWVFVVPASEIRKLIKE